MCRSGCTTQNHTSYAECCKQVQIDPKGLNLSAEQKSHDAELAAYRAAREQGIQPAGTKMPHIERANRISDATGVAYKAA